MNIRSIVSLIFISFLKFSYAYNSFASYRVIEQNACEKLQLGKVEGNAVDTIVQNFEVRAFITDIEEAQLKLSLLNANFKGEYEFTDYIYHPRDKDFDLNKEFVRLRVYQRTQWDQKAVELSHKIKNDLEVFGGLKLKKQFNTVEEAAIFLSDYRFAFSYQRTGFEYQLDDIKIFLENVQGLPPSVELLSSSKKNIDQLLDQLAPVQILTDSVPKLIQNTIGNKS